MKIEILGSGCAKCKKTEKNVRNAVEELGLEVDIVKVEDMSEIINRGVIMTPTVFIDGEAKIVGHVPHTDEIKKLIK